MTRRDVLGMAGAAGLGLVVPAAIASCSGDEEAVTATTSRRGTGTRVVVVGAGLAGLVAALELQGAGFDPVVLEARDRPGGRVWSVRSPFEEGQYAEAGGEFVDTIHTELMDLVAELDLALVETGSEAPIEALVSYRGKVVTTEELDSEAGGSVEEAVEEFESATAELVSGVPADDPTGADDATSLDAMSVGEGLDLLDLSPEGRFIVDHLVIDEYMVDPYELSLLFFLQVNAATWDLDEEGEGAYRIRGGAQAVAERISERLADVRFEVPVTRIDDRGDRVVVHVSGPQGPEEIEGRFAVVATPLGPLRRVEFDAGLPEQLKRAIAEARYGLGGKTMLQYSERYWLDAGWSGAAYTDLGIWSLYETTERQEGEAGILNTYTAGPAGLQASAYSRRDRIERARAEIESLGMGSGAEVLGSASVMWSAEQYSAGSYIAYAPGQVIPFWKAIREPVGRLHFAGEHTDTFNGYMEGAVRSGRRAAREIMERA